ncbi:MAG: S-layer homology domain-containing protein [Ruminiclostridium sp.]|nr:S-layer homology domain-containing protein [Ruminiclostridium sp.]
MRNLKKVLALVLAMAMSLSLAVTAGAAYTDGDQITDDYAVAVEVASQLGILEGFEDGSYGPQKTLTRAQLATMIYRITTGDVEDVYTANFAGGAAQSFTDTPATAWYAGYVAYSADAGFLKGMGDGTYGPNKTLTGYQALAALLRGLGYNEAGHNFCGDDWKVQVAKVATTNGILEGVTAELDKAISREVAAQMIYNALFADMVEWEGMVYEKNGETLAEEVFDIVTDKDGDKNVAGDFGRPSTEWYEAGEEDAVVSIPEAPLAVYTEAVAQCDVLDDTGLEDDDVLAVYTNGVKGANTTLADTSATIGEQGRLTEVYEDVIVFIDTYLAEVVDVITEKVDGNGHVTREAAIELDIFGAADNTFETKSFDEGDMVLVTIDAGEVATVVDAESAIGELTGLTGNRHHTTNIDFVNAIDGKDVEVAFTATNFANVDMWLDVNYVFYYDTYGNVMGAEEVASEYVVIDSIWFETIKGETTVYADVVDFAANETTEVVVGNPWIVFENKALNGAFYYDAFEYVIEDGEYFFAPAFVDFGAVSYTADDTTLIPSAQVRPIELNNDTVLLLQTAFSPDGQYTSYTGYKTFPSFWASEVEVLDEDGDGYADLVYALGARMSERTVFIADITAERTDVVGDDHIVTMEALELVDGQLVETTFATQGWYDQANNVWNPVGINAVGLYEISESDDGFTWDVDRAITYFTVDSLTTDGNRVILRGPAGGYTVLDDAEIFKFEGSWATVEDVTEDDDWTKANLNRESVVFVQEDEDGNAVAIYDMWIEMDVTVTGEGAENVVVDAPTVYFGKVLDRAINVTVPAWVDLVGAASGVATFTTAGTDAHDIASAMTVNSTNELFADVVITVEADPKHDNTGLTENDAKISINNGVIAVNVKAHETYTTENLLAALEAECEFAQGIAVFDDGVPYDGELTNYVLDRDITVEVTAEDGVSVQSYPVVIYVW